MPKPAGAYTEATLMLMCAASFAALMVAIYAYAFIRAGVGVFRGRKRK